MTTAGSGRRFAPPLMPSVERTEALDEIALLLHPLAVGLGGWRSSSEWEAARVWPGRAWSPPDSHHDDPAP
jgi:hypothetical protein